eukprot:CAMPEP_0173411650 /NCGR_PEP_ID=MMETSP1356-20130122/77572_1 /TAXON_ID=77927 ORGANISM="Hemiselmis virescens, Strain PCC157" /NCGR_SAMPLE_ID=MMETSP1356 /ASSEMBLY_ACC=CAM_ASM_000847 /LENGTH=119 /DNA_ID=CAMNT_0014373437 /DNA_START=640 /DNA_END=998 /DNA_ORIENTATION=+
MTPREDRPPDGLLPLHRSAAICPVNLKPRFDGVDWEHYRDGHAPSDCAGEQVASSVVDFFTNSAESAPDLTLSLMAALTALENPFGAGLEPFPSEVPKAPRWRDELLTDGSAAFPDATT